MRWRGGDLLNKRRVGDDRELEALLKDDDLSPLSVGHTLYWRRPTKKSIKLLPNKVDSLLPLIPNPSMPLSQ